MRPTFWCRWFSAGASPENEILPHSTVRRLVRGSECNENNNKAQTSRRSLPLEHQRPRDGPKLNEMNVQMLSRSLHRQIFGCGSTSPAPAEYPGTVKSLRDELLRHGLDVSRPVVLPEVDLTLPPLRGANIEEHFWSIAEEQCEPFLRAIETLPEEVPNTPTNWSRAPGWTRYDAQTGESKSVPFPDEQALVFDVEVCVRAGPAPTMATAFGTSGSWYSWTSPQLTGEATRPNDGHGALYQLSDMIPLESDSVQDARKSSSRDTSALRPRIVIGHNVSYDRARIREQYWLEPTPLRFLDTMSLHVCVSGVTSYQRAMLKSKKLEESGEEWLEQASLNNLADVYALYCDGATLTGKSRRNTFVDGTLEDVSADFNNLMAYCADDVRATRAVLARLWPLFRERFPHPATLAGMLEMGSAYLPVNDNWTHYLTEADLSYEDLDLEAKHLLSQRADAACALMHDDAYRRDLWLWDQDWSVQQLKLKAAPKRKKATKNESECKKEEEDECTEEEDRLASKFAHLYETASRLPARRPLLPGYPAWYRALCSKPDVVNDEGSLWQPGPAAKLGTGLQIAPKLLSLCWEGYPLHYIRGHGWGFLVPYRYERDPEQEPGEPRVPLEELVAACPVMDSRHPGASHNESTEALQHLWKNVEATISRKEYYDRRKTKSVPRPELGSGVWCNVELGGCCYFFQLPHKDGAGHRVGNPLSKDFLAKFSENVLAGDGRAAERVVEIARMLSYWRNNRDRIRGQLVVWERLAKGGKQSSYGAIVPQVVVCGTLTRRAMEPTWMTASNAQRERVGSELRAMVQAPAGYRIVGADVDSQELWIASVLGDADVASELSGNLHGATPFGWMTLSGTKATRTDMHSVTAAAVGISRDHAKVINYARIYGAGVQFAERLLKQFNPTFSEAEARSKATKMFALTKGRKVYRMREEVREQYPDAPPHSSPYEALRLARAYNRPVGELFHPPRWVGGTESAMFNRLEQIAGSEAPVTPFLDGRLSRALEPPGGRSADDRFLPTRINWVVQSGAVDFLHLMLVCMRWLMGADGRTRLRFCMSFHDEVRYLVPERYAHHAALAMHVTNLLTRAFCAHRVGFRDLPQSVAFFSTVEVDRVLRKEAQHDCRTPSNPHGLTAGYGIPDGESLDIHQTLARLGPKRSDMSRWAWHRGTGTETPANPVAGS
ncbi:DNA polymerase subunit gamma-1, mitochondrial [Anopheles ziemanni]|uniref:DNA polymerase subunit gamma-1, mitochondrial n=1 Tax=Anopheles coustani TaxID=139045 RepID=UPI00265A600A|nr:DNA polymerase subunit gamma-1, mitochondrial [Anopheles coustani]XP_058176339.1 DNA polymerase subunit gamma-1, mitochondrial [Anopheles ziemanni]